MSYENAVYYNAKRINNIDENTKSNDIIQSYIPPYIYEYAYWNSYNVKSAYLYIKLKNISGGPLTLNPYQLWLNFKDEDGNILAKQNTSSAFDAETTTNIVSPNASISNNEEYEYLIKLTNIDKELIDNSLQNIAKYWSIGFRQDFENTGTTNVFQNNAILAYQITIMPDTNI